MSPELIATIDEMLKELEFGKIEITIQNGIVLDILKTERVRIKKRGDFLSKT